MWNEGLFWIVWREGGGAPTVKHSTQIEAEKEAERLAKSLGGTFHVLQVVGSVTQAPAPPPPPPSWIRIQQRSTNFWGASCCLCLDRGHFNGCRQCGRYDR